MKVTNITACFSVATTINLDELSRGCLFARRTKGYKTSNRFFDSVRLSVYTQTKKVTALIYRSGRIVIIGADCELQLIDAKDQITCLLNTFVQESITVSNYVFTHDLKQPVNLASIYNELRNNSDIRVGSVQYEPELFPALIIKINLKHMERETKVTIFQTGKMNITGCRRREEGTRTKQVLDDVLTFLI